MKTVTRKSSVCLLVRNIALCLLVAASAATADMTGNPALMGTWIINDEESDDTDRQVEKAIKKAGGRVVRTGKRGKGRYRGGPANQALYDHLSYDDSLVVHYEGPEFHLLYDGGFARVFYSDNRSRSVSASGIGRGGVQDYSFAYWDGDDLVVESRPRDGGTIEERYTLTVDGRQLTVQMKLQPVTFGVPIEITRVFDRKPTVRQ